MRQTIAAGLFLLMLLFLPPWLRAEEPAPQEDTSPQPIQTQQAAPEDGTGSDAAHTLRLWDGSAVQTLTAAEYLPGVVRGEMPATFELEALKAQAVAERTYLYYRMTVGEKAAHPDADVCTDSNCCTAWLSEEDARAKWGDKFDQYETKVQQAVAETDGQVVLYDGAPLSGMPPEQVARRAAYMAQSRNVPSIEARRMVLHGRFPYLSFPRRYRKSDYAAVRRAMEKADALELADRPMQELSGGQRQKVYLAMALAQETPAVFMDEPTTFLDVRHQMDVMRTARGLADGGKAVVLVSHDLCQALRTADRVALLADGRLCMAGTPEQVYAGGALDRVFGVRVRRVPVDGGWQYFCE